MTARSRNKKSSKRRQRRPRFRSGAGGKPGRPNIVTMAEKASRRSGRTALFAGTEKFVTIGDWLRYAVTTFSHAPLTFAQGLHGAQEEALLLVGRFLGLELEDVREFLGSRLTPGECRSLRQFIARRVYDHVPVPYLINETMQGGRRFFVDERVLIPRSYIAGLLPEAIQKFAGRSWQPERILDVGTGSGCLAIIAAHAFPAAIVDAVDVSTEALEVAAENVAAHGLDDRVQLLQSDVFSAIGAVRYDLIIANPPYEPSALVQELPPELQHEPSLALDGGPDGMACVRRIVRGAREHLTTRGVLVLELGGLRDIMQREFPRLRCQALPIPDGTDAVIGIHSRSFSPAAKSRSRKK